eukprot:TRINITY_DN67_c0_g1_i1.p1 TRINITY_DN67_c0_g1~~TRINITY_DN67_c0_g1_i1.p1  ORF type:complete len:135 (-),score=27.52 TRINITY_DN67_c0_g1_i1:87-440(-)
MSHHHHEENHHDPLLEQAQHKISRGQLPDVPPLEDLEKAQLPFGYRDQCSGVLMRWNECRYEHWYLPWSCGGLKHLYETCQTIYFHDRMKQKMEEKGAKDMSYAKWWYSFAPGGPKQ